MEFKAEVVRGEVIVKAISERKANGDLIMHVPSLRLIKKLQEQYGKRSIRKIQS